MSVTSTQATSLLQNVLFESSTLAAATAGGYVTLSAINPLASTVAGLATVLSGSAEASIAEQVVRYYQGALGRAPSATEVAYYVNIAEAGLTSAQIQQGASAVSGTTWNTIAGYFVASPEFTNDFANNGSAIVELLYLNILGRNPSATEVAYYNAQLAQGFTNVNLVQEFTNSPEYISKTTTNIANSLANNGLAVVNGTTQGLITALTSSTGGGTTNSTYTLTTGVDIASANQFVGSLASYSATGIGPTLTIGDSLTGTGSNPTLLLTDSYNTSTSDIIPSGITLTNIATVSLTTSGNAGSAGQSFDTSPYSSVTNTVVNSSGGGNDYVKAASTSAVAVTHNSTAGNVTVYGGGTTIAVTTNSAGTATTNPNNTITYSNVAIGGTGTNQLAAATTAISLTENGSGAGAATSTVYGGAAVTVNVNTNTASGNTTIGNSSLAASTKALNPSGLITLTSVSTFGSTNIDKIYGGGSAGVTATIAGDTLTIGDAAATTATNTTTGAVTVTDALATGYNGTTAATAGGAIDVNTTGAVTVTTNAGSTVTVGATGQSGAENPAAAVTITDTSGDHSGGFNTGTFGGGTQATIFGGTAVTVTEAGGGVSIGSATASDDPTGAVTVSETAFSLQTISVDGGSSVTVNANGQAVNIGTKSGTTGLDTVNETGVYTGQGLGSSITASAITVDGGGTAGVVVNTTGGNVTVGSSSITNGLTTGAVTINNTFSGINTSNASTVTVLGGGAVTITEANTTSGAISVGAQATLNSAGASVSNLTSDPTGNVTINNSAVEGSVTSYGTSAVTVITNGGTTVSVTGASSATINDANDITASSGSAAGTSTLTTVNLDGVLGAVQLDGGLITNVAISDSFNGAPAATRVTLNGGTNPSTGVSYANEAAHTAILTLSNDSNALTSYTDSTASAITVNTSGTAKDSITLIGAKAATLNFNNTAALTVPAGDTVLSTGAVIKVTGSGSLNLGNVAGWTSATGVTSITDTGTGAVTATINGSNTSFSGGTGANIISVTTGNNGSITGGGNAASEVILNNTASTYASSLNSGNIAIKSDFTGFGILGLIGASVTGTYDVSGFNSVVLGADGTTPGTNTGLSLINLASGEQVSMT